MKWHPFSRDAIYDIMIPLMEPELPFFRSFTEECQSGQSRGIPVWHLPSICTTNVVRCVSCNGKTNRSERSESEAKLCRKEGITTGLSLRGALS